MSRMFRQQWQVLMLVTLGIMLGYGFYGQAEGLTWQFDDWINLRGLELVSDGAGLQSFVFGGVAGPGGRPLSLLSFVPDYAHWPANPWGMVQGALLWHLMNALLVFLLVRVLLSRQTLFADRAVLLAGVLAVVWALLPIHVSSLLMPVQRMVHVSAFFVLLTLLGYSYLRIKLAGRPGLLGATIIAAWTASGSLAAVLSKESGAVVVTLVALLELMVLRQLPPPSWPRLWGAGVLLALLAVPLALTGYMTLNWETMQGIYLYQRDFTLSERLATQVVVLWEYLQQTLLPRASAFGPFHDGHRIFTWGDVSVWLGVVGWAALWLYAGLGARRSIGPAVINLFALAWFFGAHQIESSLIPLELYFEHRNYLSSLGVVAAVVLLSAWGWQQKPTLRKALGVLLILVGGLQLFSLQQITSLWGQPLLAAEMWYMKHPSSMRAAQTLSWQYGTNSFTEAALRVMDEYAVADDSRVGARIQALAQACGLETVGALAVRLVQTHERVAKLRRPAEIVAGLPALGASVRDNRCPGVKIAEYRRLLLELLGNPKIQQAPRIRHHVHYELALIAEADGDPQGYLHYARLAFFDFPSVSMARLIATRYFEQMDIQGAIDWLDDAAGHAPSAAAEKAWQQEFEGLRQAIVQVKQQLDVMERTEGE